MTPTAAFLLGAVLAAAQLKAPPMIPSDHGIVVALSANGAAKGAIRWSANWTMEPWRVSGKNAVRFTETGKGVYSPFTQNVQWALESVWLADGNFFPLQFEKTMRDSQGHILAVEKKTFDRSTGKVKFERTNEKGVTTTSTLDAAPDILTVEGIAGILQNFPFSRSGVAAPVGAHLLSNEPKLYDITIESRGTERIKTLTGEVDCYKIELVPHLGVLNIFKEFYPRTILWFRVDEPHTWVRFQGLENGAGTPEIILEAR